MPIERKAMEAEQVAAALYLTVGLFKRLLRQKPAEGELSLPESSALRRLERGGPVTVTALAKAEQISVQAMGAARDTREARRLSSWHPDPAGAGRPVRSVAP